MTFTIRWIFALVGIALGIYILIKSGGNPVTVATGVGLISVGVGLVVP